MDFLNALSFSDKIKLRLADASSGAENLAISPSESWEEILGARWVLVVSTALITEDNILWSGRCNWEVGILDSFTELFSRCWLTRGHVVERHVKKITGRYPIPPTLKPRQL